MSDLLARAPAPLSARTVLREQYEIERELGRGGMATVYLARDLRTGREVAVKVLHPDLAQALGADRFRREIEIASQLTHPHILPLYDSGEAGGSLFYVMPVARGESLRQRLDREHQLGVAESVRIACEVASALDFAHRRGVIHRDIKPENILLEDGHAVVADFGIARAIGAVGEQKLTQTGVTLGTPTYMSPEQAMAERHIDGRSDVYALGCVLYEMLAGQPPFTGPSAQAVIARHTLDEVPSLSVVRGTVPDALEDAILCALAKLPADRFDTAADFAAALEVAAAEQTISRGSLRRGMPPRRTTSRRLSPVVRRTRRRRALIAAAAVLTVVLSGAAWHLWGRAPDTAAQRGPDARRVAVLYFEAGAEELRPVADGLTESLIEQLSRVQALDVVSRNAVAPFRVTPVSRDSIARALSVGTLVSGSVEEERDQLRVSVQLVDARSGASYERASFVQPRASMLAVRDTLAVEVARFLREHLGQEIRLREQRAGTRSSLAWVLVQRAEKARKDADGLRHDGEAAAASSRLRDADSLLALAEEQDREWVAPVVQRAAVAQQQALLVVRQPARAGDWIDTALAHAGRALSRDPRHPQALELRGTLAYRRVLLGLVRDQKEIERTIEEAERDLAEAVAIEPSLASAWNTLSLLQYGKQNVVESNLYARRAYEADAYLAAAPSIVWRLHATAYDLEQFVDAERWCRIGMQRFPQDPRFVKCQLLMLTTKARTPDVPEAWRLVGRVEQVAPRLQLEYLRREARILAAAAIARSGLADSARSVLLSARADRATDPRGELIGLEAMVRTLMGDRDEAIGLLQRYLADHPEHRAGFAKVNSWWWRDLQKDPRFRLLASTGG